MGLGTVIFFIMALIIYEQELSLKQSSPGSMLTDPFVIREQASEGCSEKMETFRNEIKVNKEPMRIIELKTIKSK